MTKERFIHIHTTRGYQVEDLGKMVILHKTLPRNEYSAIWFFNSDGSVDESQPPTWSIKRS